MNRKEREAMDQNLDDILQRHRDNMLFGDDNQLESPPINTKYLDAHQRAKRYTRQAH